jgi:heme exporter protein A
LDFNRVTVEDVSRHFGRRRAVTQISFSVGSGEVLGLLGPNGAGKSTLLGMLATLVRPTSGSIRYGEHTMEVSGAGIRARIGLLAHELHLYAELTARQNLNFFARLYGVDERDTGEAALERASLSESFSRGMRQRLALERALLHSPRLILMDEPFTGLDDRAVTLVSNRLRQLSEDGAIVIVATHDLDVADGLVSRVVVVRRGRLISDEPAGPGLRARYRALIGAA